MFSITNFVQNYLFGVFSSKEEKKVSKIEKHAEAKIKWLGKAEQKAFSKAEKLERKLMARADKMLESIPIEDREVKSYCSQAEEDEPYGFFYEEGSQETWTGVNCLFEAESSNSTTSEEGRYEEMHSSNTSKKTSFLEVKETAGKQQISSVDEVLFCESRSTSLSTAKFERDEEHEYRTETQKDALSENTYAYKSMEGFSVLSEMEIQDEKKQTTEGLEITQNITRDVESKKYSLESEENFQCKIADGEKTFYLERYQNFGSSKSYYEQNEYISASEGGMVEYSTYTYTENSTLEIEYSRDWQNQITASIYVCLSENSAFEMNAEKSDEDVWFGEGCLTLNKKDYDFEFASIGDSVSWKSSNNEYGTDLSTQIGGILQYFNELPGECFQKASEKYSLYE